MRKEGVVGQSMGFGLQRKGPSMRNKKLSLPWPARVLEAINVVKKVGLGP